MKQILFSASCFSHPWISLLSKERKDFTDSPGMGFSKMSLLLKNIFLTRVIRNSLRISHLSRKDWWESTGRWSCVWCHLNHGIQQYKVLEASVLSAKFITSGPCWGSISASSALMDANPNSSPCPQKSFHGPKCLFHLLFFPHLWRKQSYEAEISPHPPFSFPNLFLFIFHFAQSKIKYHVTPGNVGKTCLLQHAVKICSTLHWSWEISLTRGRKRALCSPRVLVSLHPPHNRPWQDQ